MITCAGYERKANQKDSRLSPSWDELYLKGLCGRPRSYTCVVSLLSCASPLSWERGRIVVGR